jgi:probable rRNA maturation factor
MPARVKLVIERSAFDASAARLVTRAEIVRRAKAMLRALQLNNEEVSLLLTTDEQIQELNKTYRHKDKPTDVLAFAQREGEFGALAGALLGDVIVSIPTAARQAARTKRDLLSEVTMLMAHGILHLLGWDHETAAKDRRMRRETERLCDAARPSPKRRSARRGAVKGVKGHSPRRA